MCLSPLFVSLHVRPYVLLFSRLWVSVAGPFPPYVEGAGGAEERSTRPSIRLISSQWTTFLLPQKDPNPH